MSDSVYVIETTVERFEADVLERSKSVPVVLDFWATWCQPCRRLGPLLEQVVGEYEGRVVLVKADVDQLPQQAAAFRVEGIPAVYAVRDGQVVDSFVGLLTESQLREWLQAIVPSEAQRLLSEGAELELTDSAGAEAKYRRATELEPQLSVAQIGLARILALRGNPAHAREIIEKLEARGFLEPEAERLKAQLSLQSGAANDAQLRQLQSAAESSPHDTAPRLAFADALLAAGRYEDGLAQCLVVVSEHSGDPRDKARHKMLDVFRVLGDESELTRRFRRELTLVLY